MKGESIWSWFSFPGRLQASQKSLVNQHTASLNSQSMTYRINCHQQLLAKTKSISAGELCLWTFEHTTNVMTKMARINPLLVQKTSCELKVSLLKSHYEYVFIFKIGHLQENVGCKLFS